MYSISGQDARDDFTFVDDSNDNYMSWAEAMVEAYDIDPANNEMLQEEIDCPFTALQMKLQSVSTGDGLEEISANTSQVSKLRVTQFMTHKGQVHG